MAEEFKSKGNKALQAGNVSEAISMYTKAIELDGSNHILFSNRSAAYAKSEDAQGALEDAETCIKLNPTWGKGYNRKGAALELLHDNKGAQTAYEEGLKVEPNNEALKSSLENVKESAFASPFSGPDVMAKLHNNPKTRGYLNDPSFKMKLDMLGKNPSLLTRFMGDKQILDAFSVLIGIDPDMMKAYNGDNMPDDLGADLKSSRENGSSSSNTKKKDEAKKKEEVPVTSNLSAEGESAQKEKNLGNAAYKEKRFEEALDHYDKAIGFVGNDITFHNNKAAVYFEMKRYEECVKQCEKAVEVGRENMADFKLIAKAFSRMANAHWKLDDLPNAKKYFDKSLSEHRDPLIVKKSQELNKLIKERERLAKIDPEKAEAEKVKGNEAFQNGQFPKALQHYSEAIARNPEDSKLYSNRAACYTKLMEFSLALKDCDKCISLAPDFIKGYLRKGAVLMAMKEYPKAAEAYRRALSLDKNCSEAIDGYRSANRLDSSNPEASAEQRVMQDPEIQEILSDPAMRMILEQMKNDPTALREHLKNPEIATKIQKLIEAGVIGMR